MAYKYSALNKTESEIRLMTLIPGQFQDDIHIVLKTVRLTKTEVPDYEALSYAWGSQKNPEAISVRADMPQQSNKAGLLSVLGQRRWRRWRTRKLYVTRNLAEALPYLRYEAKPRVLWIDAICVNQQDIRERGHQVKRMASLYSSARRVIVWLGPESEDSTLAIRAIDRASSQLRVCWACQLVRSASTGDVVAPRTVPIPFDRAKWFSIGRLLSRPWFERLWIWQEVRLARNAIMFCGNESIPWESFRTAIFFLGQEIKPDSVVDLVAQAARIGDYVAGFGVDLLQVLDQTRKTRCSDPRDKIFAVLNLVGKGCSSNLVAKGCTSSFGPDYSKPTEAVFQDIILHHIRKSGSLTLLSRCELRTTIRRNTNSLNMPTWIPDWSVPSSSSYLPGPSACRNSKAQTQYLNVFHNAPFLGRYRTIIEFKDAIRILIVPKLNSISCSELAGMIDAFCRTLHGNFFAEYLPAPNPDIPSFESCRKFIHRLVSTVGEAYPKYSELNTMYSNFCGRSFFLTECGYMGLAPEATKPGDQVCILLGCDAPLVLRPNRAGGYKVVGECYMDGSRDSAAFLGPLPSEWQIVSRFDDKLQGFQFTFVNRGTGERRIEDPRLGTLPAGWSLRHHKYEYFLNLYQNDQTGEITRHDPRMTAQALVARGVDVKEFRLV